MGNGFSEMMEQMQQKKGVMLRMGLEMYMPAAQQAMADQIKIKNPDYVPDAKAPFMEMKVEADVISGEPIADSAFEVPRDSHLVSVTEFLKGVLPNPGPTQSETATAPAAAESDVAH
jgi:hypothetical protein